MLQYRLLYSFLFISIFKGECLTGKLIAGESIVNPEEQRCISSCLSTYNISTGRCKENCSRFGQQAAVNFSYEYDSSKNQSLSFNDNKCCETVQLYAPSPSTSPDLVELKWQCNTVNVTCDASIVFIIQQKILNTNDWTDLIVVNSTQQVLRRRLDECLYFIRVVAVNKEGNQVISNTVNYTYPVQFNTSVILLNNNTYLEAQINLTPHVGWENTLLWNVKVDQDYSSTHPQAPDLPKTFTHEKEQITVWLGHTDEQIGQSFIFTFQAVTDCSQQLQTREKRIMVEYGKYGLTRPPPPRVAGYDLSLRLSEVDIQQFLGENSTISVFVQWTKWTDRPNYKADKITSYSIHWGNASTGFIPSIETTTGEIQLPPNQFNITLHGFLPNTQYGIQVIARQGKTESLNYQKYIVLPLLTDDVPVPSLIRDVTQLVVQPTLAMRSLSSSTSSNIVLVQPTSAMSPLKSSTSSSTVQIILPICFLIALIAVIAICCHCFIKYRTVHKSLLPGEEMVLNLYEAYAQNKQQSPKAPDRWEIPSSCITFLDVLGEGAFGQVNKAVVQGCGLRNSHVTSSSTKCVNNEPMTVAVKVLHGFADSNERQSFLQEIDLMKALGHHPNVVSLLACSTLEQPVCLVVEHCEHGDLLNYLRNHRNREVQAEGMTNSSSPLTPKDLLSFARQITLGMEYLSQKGFVHRDLAARNVLVADNKIAKIGDFGLTRYVYDDKIYLNKKGGKLPIKWMSIEAIFDHVFTSKSDIWSYGVLLSEIVTMGCTPYPAIHNRQLLKLLQQGYRMEKPDNCSHELYSIMLSCWNDRAEDRPTFTDIRYHLEDMLEQGTAYLDVSVDPYRDCFYHSTSTSSSTDSTIEPLHDTERGALMQKAPTENELLEIKLHCLSKENDLHLSISKNYSTDSGVMVSDESFNGFAMISNSATHSLV